MQVFKTTSDFTHFNYKQLKFFVQLLTFLNDRKFNIVKVKFYFETEVLSLIYSYKKKRLL